MPPNDEPDRPADREAAIPELLEDYKAQHVRLVAQARELERLREQVRGSAEREAAAIVTAARRDVRKVLLDARRELLVLVAQLQAVGCDGQADGGRFVPGEATATPTAGPGDGAEDPFAPTREIVSGARRDVREVLLEAQSELIALSDEARELRARVAKHYDSGREHDVTRPRSLQATTARGDDAAGTPADDSLASHDAFPPEAVPAEPPAAAAAPHADDLEAEHSAYASLSSPPRVWVAVSAAVAFAAVGWLAFLFSGDRQPPAAAPADERQAAATPQPGGAPEKPAVQPATSPAVPTPAPSSSAVALEIAARRPAWIRTTIDGRADIGRLFKAGQTRTVTATRDVILRVGDAGAVSVSVNGGPAAVLGGDGQVVTRRFGAPPRPVQAATAGAAPPAPLRSAVVQTAVERSAEPLAPAVQASRPDVGTTGTVDPPPPPPVPADRLAVSDSTPATDAEREILRITRRWFEAYFGGDPAGMAEVTTEDFSLTDQRGQRLPTTMPDVDRSMQQVRIEVAGDGAVLSARLTERAVIDGQVRQYVSLVSGVWIRRDGRWRLMGMRFVDPADVGFVPR
ncbi:MAG: RodZ domain-containing protein [Vicinamibacterales bacterium]